MTEDVLTWSVKYAGYQMNPKQWLGGLFGQLPHLLCLHYCCKRQQRFKTLLVIHYNNLEISQFFKDIFTQDYDNNYKN